MKKEFEMKYLREEDRNKNFPIFNLKSYLNKNNKNQKQEKKSCK